MSNNNGAFSAQQKLSVAGLVIDLQADGLMSPEDAKRLAASGVANVNSLVFLAEQKVPDFSGATAVLDMERLLGWLAERTGQDVYQIDPLKINVSNVAEVMSQAFAQRHHILAVEVHPDHVVIASAEPFVIDWESNLEHVTRKKVKRVLADPRDIARHTAEFYNMAVSVRGAHGGGAKETAAAGVTNLEQMLEQRSP